ncbi:MAG: hypothetical protein KJ623_02755 [Nanoarchaeota archaeon]|nr:hypothetical protein [Nanoarchaeota archaeon]
MKKEILNSIIITVLLISCVYFVVGGLVEGIAFGSTNYNVTDSEGNTTYSTGMNFWNYHTNYTGNNGTNLIAVSGNSRSLQFNFTLNNSGAEAFNGNITNVTIAFLGGDYLQINFISGNMTNHTCIWQMNANDIRTITFYNSTCGLSNGTTDGGPGKFTYGFFMVNVSLNGSQYNTNNLESLAVTIQINVTNLSRVYNDTQTFTIGTDNTAPRITAINISDGSVTQRVNSGTNRVYLTNSSNLTIQVTITDANIWWNNTAISDSRGGRGNISVWWNATGAATIGMGSNQTNMTNITSCTFAEGVNGCVFQATLPKSLGSFSSEGGNLSFIIVASDYFEHTSNDTNSQKGYNITFDNTAADCEITIPEGRFIIYRQHTVSCTGDINETRLYEGESDIEICKDYNSCTGTYSPQTSGTRTLRCETKDNAGNSKSCEKEVSVASRATVYDGEEAAPTAAPKALDISTQAQSTGLSTGQSTTFKYETIDHTIKIDSITSDSVTITVDDKISATIPSGQSKELDLTGDGTNDVKITLNRVLLNKADITVEKLAGATIEPQKEVTQEQKSSLAWLWWVLIAIIVIVIAYLVVSAKKKK